MKVKEKRETEEKRGGASTFLTSVKGLRDCPLADGKMQVIDKMHKDLNSEVDHANEYMNTVISSYQDDMLLAYKLEMQNVYKDYKQMNDKLEKAKEERRNNEQLKALKEELGWFRDEALKLHDRCEEQKEMIAKMKGTLDILEEDKQYFQQQLIKSKKVSKKLTTQLQEYTQRFPEFRFEDFVVEQ